MSSENSRTQLTQLELELKQLREQHAELVAINAEQAAEIERLRAARGPALRGGPGGSARGGDDSDGLSGGSPASSEQHDAEQLEATLQMIGPERLEAALRRDVLVGRVRVEQGGCTHFLRMGPVLDEEDFWSHRVFSGTLRPRLSSVDGTGGAVFAKAVDPHNQVEQRRAAVEERSMLWLAAQWQERLLATQAGGAWTQLVEALPQGHCPFQQFVRRVQLRGTYAPAEALLTRDAGETGFAPKSDVQLIDYSLQLCAATALLHEAGVVHRDIKPDNVAVAAAASGGASRIRVTLIDFDVAVHRGKGEDGERPMMGRGTVGTLGYTAPEVEASGKCDQSGGQYELQPADAYGVGKTIDAALRASAGVSKGVRASVWEVVEQLTVDLPDHRFDAAGACLLLAQIANAHGLEFAPHWVDDENHRQQN